MRSEITGLTLEQLRKRAAQDAGEGRCAEAERTAAAAGDEAATRSALAELVLQCVPSFKYRATAVLIRGGPISLVEVRTPRVGSGAGPRYGLTGVWPWGPH